MTSKIEPGAIYRAHEQAFRHTSAYVVLKDGELVARVAFQFARSGLRTTCWMHWLGVPMVKAFAGGGGYDKASASAHSAAQKISLKGFAAHEVPYLRAFVAAIKDEGRHWDGDLAAAGFTVLQAV